VKIAVLTIRGITAMTTTDGMLIHVQVVHVTTIKSPVPVNKINVLNSQISLSDVILMRSKVNAAQMSSADQNFQLVGLVVILMVRHMDMEANGGRIMQYVDVTME